MKRTFAILLALVLLSRCSNKESHSADETDPESKTDSIAPASAGNDAADPEGDTDIDEVETDEDCIFDLSTQTAEFLEGIDEIENMVWIDSIKTADILLKNGDSLIVKRGGCYHFEFSARLVTHDGAGVADTVFWLDKAKWLASLIYSDHEKKVLDSLADNRLYTAYGQEEGLSLEFDAEMGTPGFYEEVTSRGEKMQMTLSYSFE